MTNNPYIELHQCKVRATQVSEKLAESRPYKKAGVLNFEHFLLKQEEKEIKGKMTKIRSTIHPDIIA